MKASELRQKSRDELSVVLIELARESFTLKMQKGYWAIVQNRASEKSTT